MIQILCKGVSKKSKDKRKVRQKVCESTYKAIRYGEFDFIKDKKWQLTLANFVVGRQVMLVVLVWDALTVRTKATNG